LIFALSPSAHDDARHRVEHELEDGTRLVWELLDETPHDAQVAAEVELGAGDAWIARLDRIDFPPGGVAYRHVHPGPGIRRVLHGELTVDRGTAEPPTYWRGEAWFEGADDPVLATASLSEETAFVRVLLLPAKWAGRRTIRYLDPADEDKPRLQRATVLLEEPLRA
jgi:quercetin dioxygenase-like cupin family protein